MLTILLALYHAMPCPTEGEEFGAKRQIIDLVGSRLTMRTEFGAERKRATLTVTYAFQPARVLRGGS